MDCWIERLHLNVDVKCLHFLAFCIVSLFFLSDHSSKMYRNTRIRMHYIGNKLSSEELVLGDSLYY